MRRIVSWVVLYLISLLVSLLTSLVVGLASYALDFIQNLNTFLKIICYLFGGTTLLSFLFIPAIYGSFLTVFAVESIHNSKKGLRYIIFPVYMILTSIIYIFIGLREDTFYFNQIIMCIYYILLIINGRTTVAETQSALKQKGSHF